MKKTRKNVRSTLFRWLLSYIAILAVPLMINAAIGTRYGQELEEEINRANSALLTQVRNDIDTRVTDVQRLAIQIGWNPRIKELLSDYSPSYSPADYNMIMRDLRVYRMANSFVEHFYIFLHNNKDTVITENTLLSGVLRQRLIQNCSTADGCDVSSHWAYKKPPHFTMLTIDQGTPQERDVIGLIQSLPIDIPGRFDATLLITFNSSNLLGGIHNTHWLEDNLVFVLDENDALLTATGPLPDSEMLNYQALRNSPPRFSLTAQGQTYTVLHTISNETGWQYVSLMPDQIFWAKLSRMNNFMLIGTALSLLLGFILSVWLTRRNYMPLNNLVGLLRDQAGVQFNSDDNEYRFIETAFSATLHEKLEA